MTPTTTWATVRDQHLALIKALSPTSRPTVLFERIPNEAPNLEAFALKSPSASLRKFEIRKAGTMETPVLSNTDIQQEDGVTLIRIAYPSRSSLGASGALDVDQVADEDMNAIRDALENPSNYVSGQRSARCSAFFLPDDDVSIAEIECEFIYYRST